jgi:AcrR family transcriptional regulator
MVTAMAQSLARNGYAGTTVSDVVRGAGVSRETFYERFSNKEDCFLATFDAAAAVLREQLVAASPREDGSSPAARFETAVGVYLEILAAEPELARTMLIEVYAVGPASLRRRVAAMESFVELLVAAVGARDSDSRFACEALVAATSSMVTLRLASGRHKDLLELRAPLSRLARRLLPDEAEG